jgi:hypothetical protein
VSQISKYIVCCCVAVALGGFASSAKADSLNFSNLVALQNNGATRVDLLSNPGVTLVGPSVSFLVDIEGMVPAGTASLLRITYTEAGGVPIVQTFSIPAFDTVPPPYSQFFTINSPGASFQGTPATLTITIITPSSFSTILSPGHFITHTYTFNVSQPVPEPASIVLLGSGVAGLLVKLRRRRTPKTIT